MLQSAEPQKRTRICLGVCTFQRPQMLMNCLGSLARIEAGRDIELFIVVVDNNKRPDEEDTVRRYHHEGRPFLYVHESRRGISQARNAVLDKAREIGAEWVAMVDDDQTVPPHWLFEMWLAQRASDADVVESSVVYELAEPLPRWPFLGKTRRGLEVNMRQAATNGVLFRSGLAGADGMPLRFDERFAFTGSEDTDFFRRAYRGGAHIVRAPHAVLSETVPQSRLTVAQQLHKVFCTECIRAHEDRRSHGFPRAMLRRFPKVLRCLVTGLARAAWAPFASFASAPEARRNLLLAGQNFARAAAIPVGLFGLARPERYRTVHGG